MKQHKTLYRFLTAWLNRVRRTRDAARWFARSHYDAYKANRSFWITPRRVWLKVIRAHINKARRENRKLVRLLKVAQLAKELRL